MDWLIWIVAQLIIMGIFWLFISSRGQKKAASGSIRLSHYENNKEHIELKRLRSSSLNVPLSELSRPKTMKDIIGQEEGIKALRAALCGPNPQHVIIYGPPGVGKTCAARLVLEEAKRNPRSPFGPDAKFVEVDATCVRFDERAIADPLIGSVHDPIYQGAGVLGTQGIPQPKPGAVTKAHCGILFLDEIGELHPTQMNKLLKVLEDRKVFFDSAYYSKDNHNIPSYIHDIFQNGLPADFRLVGATTRDPEDIPAALRSRCVELYFRPLCEKELEAIARGAANRLGCKIDDKALQLCAKYSQSGRDSVNIIQLAAGAAYDEGRSNVEEKDIEWVARTCKYARRVENRLREHAIAGTATGMAVSGSGAGVVMEIECAVYKTAKGQGRLELSGAVEEEEFELRSRRLKRKSSARASMENVLGCFYNCLGIDCRDYDIRFNIPGGMPMDGPSAGIAMAVALMSALTKCPPKSLLALTGEITIHGEVGPVGGVREKINAAVAAGAKYVIIPHRNWEDEFSNYSIDICTANTIHDVLKLAFDEVPQYAHAYSGIDNASVEITAASPVKV